LNLLASIVAEKVEICQNGSFFKWCDHFGLKLRCVSKMFTLYFCD